MAFLVLLVCFIVIPIIEISLLIKIGSSVGLPATIFFVILTAVLGAYLVRRQGFEAINKMQVQLQQGQVPATAMLEGMALLIAGAVLLTPGFITDLLGFSLLIPFVRKSLVMWAVNAKNGFRPSSVSDYHYQQGNHSSTQGTIIDGEVNKQE